VLIEIMPAMRRALSPGGRAILSGILAAERPQMMEALTAGGWTMDRELVEGEWWSCAIAPR
jgi:ribosomal protein L11 methyltransferase